MFNFLKKTNKNEVFSLSKNIQSGANESAPVKPEEEFSPLGKIKILLAIMIVGFGVYAAYWAQEPVQNSADVKADVLNQDSGQSVVDANPSPSPDPSPTPTPEPSQSLAPSPNPAPADQNVSDSNNADVSNQADVNISASEAQADKLKVSIADFKFDPPSLKIEKGQKVTWTNNDTVPHTVTADDFSSETLNPGETFEYTFEKEGTFEYHCSFHPQMKGEIVVGNVVAATENSVKDVATSDASNLHSSPDKADLKPADVDYSYLDQNDSNSQLLASTDSTTESTKIDPLSTSTGKIIRSTRIPSSGPEDVIYVAALGGILYLNRKKLLQHVKR